MKGFFSLLASLLCFALGCGGESSPTPSAPDQVAVTDVGTPLGDAVGQEITESGGTLTSADGRLTVIVPAGALAGPTTLTIQSITNEAPGGVGAAFRLGPEGTTFETPVTLRFAYTAADLGGADEAGLEVSYQDVQQQWNALKRDVRDAAASTIAVETGHFSDWSLVEDFQLRPPQAALKTGQSLELKVYFCSDQVEGSDDLSQLRLFCRSDSQLFAVDQWAVNGVANGNASFGTIGGATATSAKYTAPPSEPQQNPVAVSASTTDKKTKKKTVLSANVFITDHPKLGGTVKSTQKDPVGLTITTTADVTFVWDEPDQYYVLDPSSGVTAHWDISADGCETHAAFDKTLTKDEGTIVIFDLGYFPTGATTGTFVGTTSCGGAPEPFSVDQQIEWWPSPAEGVLAVKPDGSLDDGFVNQMLGSGLLVSANWTLKPLLE